MFIYDFQKIDDISLSDLINQDKIFFVSQNNDLIENIILLHLFKELKKYHKKKLQLRFDNEFQFLNCFLKKDERLSPENNSYVIIKQLGLDDRKLPFWKKKKNLLDHIGGITNMRLSPLTSFLNQNYKSDIIGICISESIQNQKSNSYIKKIKHCLSKMRLQFYEYYCNKKNSYTNTIPKPFNVVIKERSIKIPFKRHELLIDDLKKIKSFVGNMNEIFLLAYLILGKDNCILLETTEYPEMYLNFFNNRIALDECIEDRFILYFTKIFEQEITNKF